jgi:hypothetical protein
MQQQQQQQQRSAITAIVFRKVSTAVNTFNFVCQFSKTLKSKQKRMHNPYSLPHFFVDVKLHINLLNFLTLNIAECHKETYFTLNHAKAYQHFFYFNPSGTAYAYSSQSSARCFNIYFKNAQEFPRHIPVKVQRDA